MVAGLLSGRRPPTCHHVRLPLKIGEVEDQRQEAATSVRADHHCAFWPHSRLTRLVDFHFLFLLKVLGGTMPYSNCVPEEKVMFPKMFIRSVIAS